MKKSIRKVGIGLSVVLLCLVIGITVIFGSEISALSSIKKISDYPFYKMKVAYDYGLDEYAQKGAKTDEELTSFVSQKLMKGMQSVVPNPDGACSTFKAVTPDGDVIMARNFDYGPSTALMVRSTPKNGYHSITMVNLNHIGFSKENTIESSFKNKIMTLAAPYIPLDGINEKGLAIGVLVVREQIVHQDTGKTPVTTTPAIRLILDRAETVEEAIEILRGLDMNSSGEVGYHFHISDAKGDSAVVEYINDEMQIVRSENEEGYLVATNFTLSTEEKNGAGQDRYEIITKGLEQEKGVLTEEEAMQLLCAARFDGVKATGGDKTNPYYFAGTQWSAVYNLTKHTMKLCVGMDYDTVYEETIK